MSTFPWTFFWLKMMEFSKGCGQREFRSIGFIVGWFHDVPRSSRSGEKYMPRLYVRKREKESKTGDKHTIVKALGPLISNPGHDRLDLGVYRHTLNVNVCETEHSQRGG